MKTSPFRITRALQLGSFLLFAGATIGSLELRAQSQSDQSQSVAEAARKAREQKKAAKNNAVITEDTINLRPASYDTGASPPAGTIINTTPVMPSAEGSTANSAEPAKPTETPAPDAGAPASSEADAKKAAEQAAEIAKTKELLQQMQSELDILKRQLALDSDSFYSKADYAHDSDGKSRLDDLQRTIDDKKSSVEDLKQRLQALMQEAGISADAEKPAAPPKP